VQAHDFYFYKVSVPYRDAPKMKVSRNCVTKLLSHPIRDFGIFFFKIPSFTLFFNFFVFFFIFLNFSLLFHLFILVKKFWKLLWFFFVCIGDLSKQILKNSEIFFSDFFFLKKQPYYVGSGASNRCNMVDITSVGSRN